MDDFDQPMTTDFFDTLGRIKAQPAGEAEVLPPAVRSIASVRGYEDNDLNVIAEMATNYLFNGGHRLAVTLFEGLVAVEPNNAYYAMGLGLTYDRMGNKSWANACYRAASRLAPSDGRPDVNRAELALEAGDRKKARDLLRRGLKKATKRRDLVLARKAQALLTRISSK